MSNIRKLTEADFDDVFALSQFAFQYKLSDEALLTQKEDARSHTIFGWLENDELAGKVHIIPFSCYIHGEEIDMGGIAAVATWPEYRRQGIIKQLLYESLVEMKKQGQVISFLHPFSFAFYRKYGWEYTFNQKHYKVPIKDFNKAWGTHGYVRRVHDNLPLLQKIYQTYAKRYNGMLARDEHRWRYHVLSEDLITVVAYNESGEAEGYLMFQVKNRLFTVKEIVATTLNGWKLLLEFIANHDSMVEEVKMIVPENDQLSLLLDNPRFEQRIYPYFMARIVDVPTFLEAYPFQGHGEVLELSLAIQDDFFPENSGIYQLSCNGGNVNITRSKMTETQGDIHCSIQQLTSMLIGFKRPLELYELGLITGKRTKIEQLERIVPSKQTYLMDFF